MSRIAKEVSSFAERVSLSSHSADITMEKSSTQSRSQSPEWIIVVCLLLLSIFITGCTIESKAMNNTNFWDSVDKLTTMKFSNREEAEKVLGVELKTAEGNEYVSFYEYNGELPAFPKSTYTDVRISNDGKGRWFMMVDFNLATCITAKTIMEKYPNGVFEPPDPNNLSDDAESTYEVKVNSGKLVFGFNNKTDCFTGMSFNKTR
jgi:hypothetical protein